MNRTLWRFSNLMLARFFRISLVLALMVLGAFAVSGPVRAQDEPTKPTAAAGSTIEGGAPEVAGHKGGEGQETPPVFDKEQGTVLHPLTQKLFGQDAPVAEAEAGAPPR